MRASPARASGQQASASASAAASTAAGRERARAIGCVGRGPCRRPSVRIAPCLFPALTGLAVGLAPKEWRYACEGLRRFAPRAPDGRPPWRLGSPASPRGGRRAATGRTQRRSDRTVRRPPRTVCLQKRQNPISKTRREPRFACPERGALARTSRIAAPRPRLPPRGPRPRGQGVRRHRREPRHRPRDRAAAVRRGRPGAARGALARTLASAADACRAGAAARPGRAVPAT